jgi:hypothetical protein
MDISRCHSCEGDLDDGDNFCRQCGTAVGHAGVPAVRQASSMTVWQPNVSPIVKGAAVMAEGTVGQFLFRRMISNLVQGAGRSGRRALRINNRDGVVDEAQVITETVMLRRVRIRRQA